MSIIFATAPIVNAIVSLAIHPPHGGVSSIRWQFFAGILLAALGGMMVTLYKPGPGKPAAPAAVGSHRSSHRGSDRGSDRGRSSCGPLRKRGSIPRCRTTWSSCEG